MLSLISLVAGIIIGYLGQRSGLCLIGGLRDYYLIRDTRLLRGLIGLIVSAAVGYFILSMLGGAAGYPAFTRAGSAAIDLSEICHIPHIDYSSTTATTLVSLHGSGFVPLWGFVLITVLAAIGFGFFSVLVDGCPLRQHVMAGEGSGQGIAYVLGFYLGALIFTVIVVPLLGLIPW